MNGSTAQNPWKGLQSYQESDQIYGRDEEIKALYTCIKFNTQTVLYGKSGIGKSSILNAGIIPKAKLDDMLPVNIRLAHTVKKGAKPTMPYVEQIRQRIAEELEAQGGVLEELVSHDPAEPETLWELMHRHRIWVGEGDSRHRVTPLLLFDQFEEIFTLESDTKRVEAFFNELADLLNEIMPESLSRRRVVCADPALPSEEPEQGRQRNIFSRIAVKERSRQPEYEEKSDFRIVITLREDFLSYLERYTAYIPVMKSNRFALLPLNEEQAADIIMSPQKGLVSKNVAELIIQKVTGHKDFTLDGIPEISVDATVLSLYLSRLYVKKPKDASEITGELIDQFSDDIIRDFYEESVADIAPDVMEKVEDELLTYDNRRNNVSRADLIREGISEEVINLLVNDRKLLRQFSYSGDIRIEFMHDILCKVVGDRVDQRQQEKELERARIGEQLMRRRNRQLLAAFVSVICMLAAVAAVLWDGLCNDIEVRYGTVVKRRGWFEGLERISASEASYRPYHYVLKFNGRWAKYPYAMEARNGYDELTAEHSITTYILNQYDETDEGALNDMKEKLKTICQWEFVCNQKGDFMVQERALDKDGMLIFAYNRSATANPSQVICTYTDDYGFPLMLRDDTYFYIRTTYDDRGLEVLMEFYDDQGMPITNKDGAYQTRCEYLDNGMPLAEYSCFLDGRRTIDRAGNCGWIHTEFTADNLRVTEAFNIDADLLPCRTSIGPQIIAARYKYDEHGRLVETSYWDESGNPDECAYGYHAVRYEYNRYGQTTRWSLFDCNMEPCANIYGLYEIVYDYDIRGNNILEESICEDSRQGHRREYASDGTCIKEEIYSVDSDGEETVTFSFTNDLAARIKKWKDDDDGYCTRKSYDEKGNFTSVAYYDIDDRYPIEVDGYHINRREYQYSENETRYTDVYYDKNNVVVESDKDDYARMEAVVDSVNNTESILMYDESGRFLRGFRKKYDDLKSAKRRIIYEESLDKNMNTIRTYDNYAFYYRAVTIYPVRLSRSSEIIGWYAENEFGEPSLIYHQGRVYYANYWAHNENLYFDELGQKIIDPYEQQWDYLARVEVKAESEFGFKDGDIVLACNNWCMVFDDENPNQPFEYNLHFWDDADRNFIVARPDTERKEYDTVHVFVPESIDDIKQYVEFKVQRCNKHERAQIKEVIDSKVMKPMIYCHVKEDSEAYRAGASGWIILLEYNDWCFMDGDMDYTSLTERNRDGHKHVVYLDYETYTIGEFDTDAETMGLEMLRIIRTTPWYYNTITRTYSDWKTEF